MLSEWSITVVPNFFYAVGTCHFQQNVVAHHHRRMEKSTLNLYLGTNMSKQSMFFMIMHRISFNFSISNTKQTER